MLSASCLSFGRRASTSLQLRQRVRKEDTPSGTPHVHPWLSAFLEEVDERAHSCFGPASAALRVRVQRKRELLLHGCCLPRR
jgi:hypothetical protein